MTKPINEIVDELFRRGFSPPGVAYVLGLLANEIELPAKQIPDLAFRHMDLVSVQKELITDS